MLYRSFRACEVFRRDRPRLTCRVRHRDMTWALCLLNFSEAAFFGREFKSMLTIDIVKLILIFSVVFFKVLLIYFLKVVQVIRTFAVDTFVHNEVFAVFLGNQGVAAMRTAEL